MKKAINICFVLLAVVSATLFLGCKKDTECKAQVICKYSWDGINIEDQNLPGCYILLGKEDFADFAKSEGFANDNGIYETTFEHEALLDISASKTVETSDGQLINFVGKGQIRLVAGELATAEVILYPEE